MDIRCCVRPAACGAGPRVPRTAAENVPATVEGERVLFRFAELNAKSFVVDPAGGCGEADLRHQGAPLCSDGALRSSRLIRTRCKVRIGGERGVDCDLQVRGHCGWGLRQSEVLWRGKPEDADEGSPAALQCALGEDTLRLG